MFSATKPVYLKAASSPRFITMDVASTTFMPLVRFSSGLMMGGSPPTSGRPESRTSNKPQT